MGHVCRVLLGDGRSVSTRRGVDDERPTHEEFDPLYARQLFHVRQHDDILRLVLRSIRDQSGYLDLGNVVNDRPVPQRAGDAELVWTIPRVGYQVSMGPAVRNDVYSHSQVYRRITRNCGKALRDRVGDGIQGDEV